MTELWQEHSTLIWLENVQRHWKRRDKESCDAVCRVIASSYAITSTDRHPKCRFQTASSPIVFDRFGPHWLLFVAKLKKNSWKDGNLLTSMMLFAPQMAGWRTNIKNSSTMAYGLWRIAGPSAFLSKGTMLKSNKYHVHILLTISGYELFECPSYWEVYMVSVWVRNLVFCKNVGIVYESVSVMIAVTAYDYSELGLCQLPHQFHLSAAWLCTTIHETV